MKGASALGAKTARACDSCLRVRARWYCAADDAFLCHGCDNLVHSANQLASRHERVRLQTASSKVNHSLTTDKVNSQSQAWHSGFTRKARTPRHNKQQQQRKDIQVEAEGVVFNNTNTLPLVPELGSEEPLLDDETDQEQLLCRVPVFDPFDEGFCSIYNEVKDETMKNNDVVAAAGEEEADEAFELDNFNSEFLPSDLAEFAADVESLLGCKEEDVIDGYVNGLGAKGAMVVKVKDEELEADTSCHLDSILDMDSEVFDWNIDSSESLAQKEAVPLVASDSTKVGSSEADVQCCYGEGRSLMGQPIGGADGGREARVSRYREKRRTRLFAKKIRYEVRKLNAEKRPRMKGRFVKRTSFVGATALQAQLPLTSK
ncbi:CCT domain [Sesbania bispinosa]|nr:CCT domain [Sesbania bispinosa]